MTIINRAISIPLMFFFMHSAYADMYKVGNKIIEIPPPPGFAKISKKMGVAYRISQLEISPRTEQLEFYISKSNISLSLKNNLQSLDRYFIAAVSHSAKNMTVDTKLFSALKNILRLQNKKLVAAAKSRMPKLMKKISKGMSKELNAKVSLQISDMTPLESHSETENSFSYSMYIKYKGSADKTRIKGVIPATITFVRVADRVIFLMAYGQHRDINWTRRMSKAWSTMVISSNSR